MVHFLTKKSVMFLSRFSLFLIYFWFGILKPLGLSHANELVHTLFQHTFLSSFFSAQQFIFLFGLFEVLIGIFFLFPSLTKLSVFLTFFHIFTTFLPLFILPQITWSSLFVPTLIGQYILKNLAILSLVSLLFLESKKEKAFE